MPSDYQSLLEYALRLISKKRYTEAEIQKKLAVVFKKHSLADENAISQVIERLKELLYLDDEKFAKDFISERIKFRPRGKFLLRRELKNKGLSENIIEAALKDTDLDESEIAFELLNSKAKKWRDESMEQRRRKSYQFLASRGFNLDAIYKAIARCYNDIAK